MNKLKVYVGCSLAKAPDEFKNDVTAFKLSLSDTYEVIEFLGQTTGTNSDVYQHDMACIQNADFIVAVCDEPSTGLGVEIERARQLRKPTLVLAQTNSHISRLILGMAEKEPTITCMRYEHIISDAPKLVATFVASHLA